MCESRIIYNKNQKFSILISNLFTEFNFFLNYQHLQVDSSFVAYHTESTLRSRVDIGDDNPQGLLFTTYW
jgi:hypothetical protein